MQHEISCCPLAITAASGPPYLSALRNYFSARSIWQGRVERYAVQRVLADEDTYFHQSGGARAREAWCTASDRCFVNRVLCVETVAPVVVVDRNQKVSNERLYCGISTRSFTNAREAVGWNIPHLLAKFAYLCSAMFSAPVRDACLRFAAAEKQSHGPICPVK